MNKLLVGGLSIVVIGLMGFVAVHIVDVLVYTLWLVMANPIHAILLSLVTLSLLLLPSKK